MKFILTPALKIKLTNLQCPTNASYYAVLPDTITIYDIITVAEKTNAHAVDQLVNFYDTSHITLRSKLEQNGFTSKIILDILSQRGGASNLEHLIFLYSHSNELVRNELERNGFTSIKQLQMFLTPACGNNLIALLDLYQKNKSIKEELFADGFSLATILDFASKPGGHYKLKQLIYLYAPENKNIKKELNIRGLTTVKILNLFGTTDSTKKLEEIINLFKPDLERKMDLFENAKFTLDDILLISGQLAGNYNLKKLTEMLSNPNIYFWICENPERKDCIMAVALAKSYSIHSIRFNFLKLILENSVLRNALNEISEFRALTHSINSLIKEQLINLAEPIVDIEGLQKFIKAPYRKRKNEEMEGEKKKERKIDASPLTFFAQPAAADTKAMPVPQNSISFPGFEKHIAILFKSEKKRIQEIQQILAPQLSTYILPTSYIANLFKTLCSQINKLNVESDYVYLSFSLLEKTAPLQMEKLREYQECLNTTINCIISLVKEIMSSDNQLLVNETSDFMYQFLQFNEKNLAMKKQLQEYLDSYSYQNSGQNNTYCFKM